MLDQKDLLKKFGKYIRQNRVINEIKQEEVAEAVGITQPQYSRIESGVRRVEFDLAMKICEFIHADITEFINDYINKE